MQMDDFLNFICLCDIFLIFLVESVPYFLVLCHLWLYAFWQAVNCFPLALTLNFFFTVAYCKTVCILTSLFSCNL